MNVPGYSDGVSQIEGTRKANGSWIVRFTCTRTWSMTHHGNVGCVFVGRGQTHQAALEDACDLFWGDNERYQQPLPGFSGE